MCHQHLIMLTSSFDGPIGGGLPIGHFIHLNYHPKYHGSEETTHAPQSGHNGSDNNFYNAMYIRPVLAMCIQILDSQS